MDKITEFLNSKRYTPSDLVTIATAREAIKMAIDESSLLDAQVMQKARLFTKAKIQLLGVSEPKEVPITNISFKDGQLFSVTVEYPLGNNYYDHLTYYFDGRKLGEEKDIDVGEIFKGFSA